MTSNNNRRHGRGACCELGHLHVLTQCAKCRVFSGSLNPRSKPTGRYCSRAHFTHGDTEATPLKSHGSQWHKQEVSQAPWLQDLLCCLLETSHLPPPPWLPTSPGPVQVERTGQAESTLWLKTPAPCYDQSWKTVPETVNNFHGKSAQSPTQESVFLPIRQIRPSP